jgi:D-alanyl-lipoteichoic acid acyltransferase DltB (MBOAT superfamily)
MSYTIDVYRKKLKHERCFINFATYVAFFPQLVAGPIERASNLLPQIRAKKIVNFDGAMLGLRLFLWGMFKKLFIADNLATIVDFVFSDPERHTPVTLLIAAYCFFVQIYCDFSGYTDMARGLAKMLGINLSVNFNLPFFAKSGRDFWQRWHISLSTWFRLYVYIPLGGNRGTVLSTIRNLIITFLLSGLWHGAGWNFILWGLLHGLWLSIELLARNWKTNVYFHKLPISIRMFITFNLITFLFVLFRSPDLDTFIIYINSMINSPFNVWPSFNALVETKTWFDMIALFSQFFTDQDRHHLILCAFYTAPLIWVQWQQYQNKDLLIDMYWGTMKKVIVYSLFLALLVSFGTQDGKQFIYFQF